LKLNQPHQETNYNWQASEALFNGTYKFTLVPLAQSLYYL